MYDTFGDLPPVIVLKIALRISEQDRQRKWERLQNKTKISMQIKDFPANEFSMLKK